MLSRDRDLIAKVWHTIERVAQRVYPRVKVEGQSSARLAQGYWSVQIQVSTFQNIRGTDGLIHQGNKDITDIECDALDAAGIDYATEAYGDGQATMVSPHWRANWARDQGVRVSGDELFFGASWVEYPTSTSLESLLSYWEAVERSIDSAARTHVASVGLTPEEGLVFENPTPQINWKQWPCIGKIWLTPFTVDSQNLVDMLDIWILEGHAGYMYASAENLGRLLASKDYDRHIDLYDIPDHQPDPVIDNLSRGTYSQCVVFYDDLGGRGVIDARVLGFHLNGPSQTSTPGQWCKWRTAGGPGLRRHGDYDITRIPSAVVLNVIQSGTERTEDALIMVLTEEGKWLQEGRMRESTPEIPDVLLTGTVTMENPAIYGGDDDSDEDRNELECPRCGFWFRWDSSDRVQFSDVPVVGWKEEWGDVDLTDIAFDEGDMCPMEDCVGRLIFSRPEPAPPPSPPSFDMPPATAMENPSLDPLSWQILQHAKTAVKEGVTEMEDIESYVFEAMGESKNPDYVPLTPKERDRLVCNTLKRLIMTGFLLLSTPSQSRIVWRGTPFTYQDVTMENPSQYGIPRSDSWIQTNAGRILAVDLDATIAEYDVWRGASHIGEPIDGAREALRELSDAGYIIVIYTARINERPDAESSSKALVADYLKRNGIPFDYIESKMYADFYIDDRALRFDGDWQTTVDKVKTTRPWYHGRSKV